MKNQLIASCGMNCSICYAYLREKNKCPGCKFFNLIEPISIVRCKIKNCEFIKNGRIKYCFECDNFPCKNLKHLDKRYRTKYNMSEIENLETIKKVGIKEFIKTENIKWSCPKCGGTICLHKKCCLYCGKIKS